MFLFHFNIVSLEVSFSFFANILVLFWRNYNHEFLKGHRHTIYRYCKSVKTNEKEVENLLIIFLMGAGLFFHATKIK